VIRAVLDANVLASGAVNAGGPSGQLVDATRAGEFDLIISDHILSEVGRTFEKRYFRSRLGPEQIAAFDLLLRRQASLTPLTVQVHGVATHPADDLVLATALSGQADYLVTGDTKLQQLGSHQGVIILSPRAFLGILRQDANQ
jgi:uncharacterized protein